MYGAHWNNRCPSGYGKLDVLGKGGCAVVWLGLDRRTREKVAIKQFPKCSKNESNYHSGLAEVKIARSFYQPGGEPHEAYKDHPGLESMCKLLAQSEDKNDLWLVYELCGKPLSKLLF